MAACTCHFESVLIPCPEANTLLSDLLSHAGAYRRWGDAADAERAELQRARAAYDSHLISAVRRFFQEGYFSQ